MSWKEKVKNWNGKLYKVLQGNKSCHGGDFEWSLPKENKPGDWTPTIEDVKMYEKGYHLTTHYAHWSEYVYNIFVYEAEGNIVKFDGYDKVVCTRARLLKKVENPFNKCNIGIRNSGNYNSGSWNSGCFNLGYFCTGYRYLMNLFQKIGNQNFQVGFILIYYLKDIMHPGKKHLKRLILKV